MHEPHHVSNLDVRASDLVARGGAGGEDGSLLNVQDGAAGGVEGLAVGGGGGVGEGDGAEVSKGDQGAALLELYGFGVSKGFFVNVLGTPSQGAV